MKSSWLKSRVAAVALVTLLAAPAYALTADQQSAIQAQVSSAVSANASGPALESALETLISQLMSQYGGQDLLDALSALVVAAAPSGNAGVAANAVIDAASPEVAGAALGDAATKLRPRNRAAGKAIAQAVANSGVDALIVAFSDAAPKYAKIARGNPHVEGVDEKDDGNTAGGKTPPPCANPSCV